MLQRRLLSAPFYGGHLGKWPSTLSKAKSEMTLYPNMFLIMCSIQISSQIFNACITKCTIHAHIGWVILIGPNYSAYCAFELDFSRICDI